MTKNPKVPVNVQPQTAFDFGLLHRCDEEFRNAMIALSDVFGQVNNLTLAGATNIDKGDLPKMFEAGSGRHMRLKAALQIATFGSFEQRRRIVMPIARCLGFEIAEGVAMSAEEKVIRYEAKFHELGPIGEQAMHDALGKR